MIYETLRWTQGQFAFRSLPAESFPALARDAALGISVDGLLLEGFRRVDEWRVIEREIGDFDLVFVPNESRIAEVARGQLTRDEIAVLEFVNGKTPVKDIIRALRSGRSTCRRILVPVVANEVDPKEGRADGGIAGVASRKVCPLPLTLSRRRERGPGISYSLSRLRERVGERASLARADLRIATTRPRPLVRRLDHQPQLRRLRLRRDVVAVHGAGEAALRRQASCSIGT